MVRTGQILMIWALACCGTLAFGEDHMGSHMGSHMGGQGSQMAAGESAGAGELHQQMTRSSDEMRSLPMTGDIDRDFMTAMKKHHQDGIEMAQIALRSSKDPEVRAMAQKIVEDQKKDVSKMDAWLGKHKAPAGNRDHGEMK